MNNKLTIPLAIIAGGIIVALALYVSVPKKPAGSGNPELVRPVSAADHILGNPAAKVKIIEYSDFDCEYCKAFHGTLHQIVANAGAKGEVAWVFREFPLIEIHPNALAAARAAECVGETAGNDAFWEFTDKLFAAQPADPKDYGALAQAAGAKGDAFATCYANAQSTLDERIMADRKNALDMGAGGTPYSVIITTGDNPPLVMAGGYSYDAVKQLVDQALAQ